MFHFTALREAGPKQEPSSSGALKASAKRCAADALPPKSSSNPKATAESAPAAAPSASLQRASCASSGSGSSLAGAASHACRIQEPRQAETSVCGSPSASLSRHTAFSNSAFRRVSAAAAGAGVCCSVAASPPDSGGSRTLSKQRRARRSMLRSAKSLPNSRQYPKCSCHSARAALWDRAASQAITASASWPPACNCLASSWGRSEFSNAFSLSSWK
mmetsp:Transcript_125471/g.366499  ORF Transcript_125471/g.366499 Transcript_125471/m.366499 type:complete len:217 (+) Transcript_125471:445-1095(+)